MRKQDALKICDEVMNNRDVDSIRNAILSIKSKIMACHENGHEPSEYRATLRLRGKNPLYCTGKDYYEGAKYINIDTAEKIDTGEYGAYWYSDEPGVY